jgi:hypothetical protein
MANENLVFSGKSNFNVVEALKGFGKAGCNIISVGI